MSPDMRNGAPPDTERRPEESSTRIGHSVPAPVVVWGVVEVDLAPHADPHGWINQVPHTALPYAPPCTRVRINIGDVFGVGSWVLHQIAETIAVGCQVEICGRRDSAVADVVTALREVFARAEGAA